MTCTPGGGGDAGAPPSFSTRIPRDTAGMPYAQVGCPAVGDVLTGTTLAAAMSPTTGISTASGVPRTRSCPPVPPQALSRGTPAAVAAGWRHRRHATVAVGEATRASTPLTDSTLSPPSSLLTPVHTRIPRGTRGGRGAAAATRAVTREHARHQECVGGNAAPRCGRRPPIPPLVHTPTQSPAPIPRTRHGHPAAAMHAPLLCHGVVALVRKSVSRPRHARACMTPFPRCRRMSIFTTQRAPRRAPRGAAASPAPRRARHRRASLPPPLPASPPLPPSRSPP